MRFQGAFLQTKADFTFMISTTTFPQPSPDNFFNWKMIPYIVVLTILFLSCCLFFQGTLYELIGSFKVIFRITGAFLLIPCGMFSGFLVIDARSKRSSSWDEYWTFLNPLLDVLNNLYISFLTNVLGAAIGGRVPHCRLTIPSEKRTRTLFGLFQFVLHLIYRRI